MEKAYMKKKAFLFAIFLLVLGGLNIGSVLLFKTDCITSIFGKKSLLTNVLFTLIALSAICVGFSRDSYLPFLGSSVMPCSLLNPQEPKGSNYEVQVSLRPGSKVLYWAAEPANHDLQFVTNWRNAYRDYKNAGVAIADGAGKATLRLRKPQSYTVPIKGELQPHVHYRLCEDLGMIGPVRTITFDGKEKFGNYVSAQESNQVVENPPPAPEPPAPETAMHRLNQQAAYTARMSLMTQTGALDEFRPSKAGAALEYAF